jgi:thiol-disulfide isomerase/thioredoxin
MKRLVFASLIFGLLALMLPFSAAQEAEFTYAGEVPAPEFPAGLAWLNVSEALTLADLQGKIVLLDFWTYGCINCMHVIPDLKRLEAEYPDSLVVVGVHSAKFDNEGVTENIRQIVQRYGVQHPVVNDVDFQIWNTYGANAWPTAGLIDPLGRVVGGRSGEGVYEFFKPIIEVMDQEYRAAGLINTTPLAKLSPETAKMTDTPLRFPGKVLVDGQNDRLFIADSGHHRIIVASLATYDVLHIIGSGEAGLKDGDYTQAQFNNPQGLALAGDLLYVADTDNHALRQIDLATQEVTRLAGTGVMATRLMAPGPALGLDLRSPWDVYEQEGQLYIAMAGTHQLWVMDLAAGTLAPFAGNGREDLIDGPLAESELAQPSDVVSDGEWVYFADSESSAIRRAQIGEGGVVETLIGPVNEPQARLFTFGDVDGGINEARLQHPLGVAIGEGGLLYVADTYNNKIKLLDPVAKTIEAFVGDAQGGYFDGAGAEALFDEPGGLEYYAGKLYVADTNNHAIRVIDTADRSVSTVIFPNVNLLVSGNTSGGDVLQPLGTSEDLFASDKVITLEPQTAAPGEATLFWDAAMPFGYKLNAQAPFTLEWTADPVLSLEGESLSYQQITPELPIQFPVTLAAGQTEFRFDVTIYWCESINETLCFVERAQVVMPLNVSAESTNTLLFVDYSLTPPSN